MVTKKRPSGSAPTHAPTHSHTRAEHKPAPTPAADDAVIPVEYTQQFLDRSPPLDDAAAVAFASQCDDAEADALGRDTLSDNVAADGRRALKRGERMLAAYPASIGYTTRRLVYLAHCLRELERKIAQQKQQRSDGAPRLTPEDAEAALRSARADLVHSLQETLEGNADFAKGLAGLSLDATTPRAALDATARAVQLATEVRAKTDPMLRVLVEEHKLTAGLVDQARRAGRALQNAIDGKADVRTQGDSPEVNRAEGRVLFELRKLKRALDFAHQKNALVERYVPSPALRAVFGGHTGHSKTPAEPSGATQDPSAAKK